MKRRLEPFSLVCNTLAKLKGLLPSMSETFRTHDRSLLLKCTVPFSSMGNTQEFVDDVEKAGGRPLTPISISNKDLQLPSPRKDWNISSKGLLPSMAETYRTHDWPLLPEYIVPPSLLENTPECVDNEEKAEGRHLKLISISDKDLQLPSFIEDWEVLCKLKVILPSMAETFKTKDWSLLRKFISMDSNLNIEDALKSELAAICVWFLFTDVPPHVKEGVARTLTFISLGTFKATKMSTDQTGVENLVVRILSSGNTEAQRQVCLALYVLASCPSECLAVSFGTGIADQLLQLVRNCNPDLTCPVLRALVGFSMASNGMREKIVETELLDSWLVKFLSREDESIMEEACWMVVWIASKPCNCELWDHLKEKLLPPIVEGLFHTYEVALLEPAVRAIRNITEFGSSDQIEDLVEMGGLKLLFYACSIEDPDLLMLCFVAIENILKAGDAKAKAKGKAKADKLKDEKLEDEDKDKVEMENEYAKMIDDYIFGWDVLILSDRTDKCYTLCDEIVSEAEGIVNKYRPRFLKYWPNTWRM